MSDQIICNKNVILIDSQPMMVHIQHKKTRAQALHFLHLEDKFICVKCSN